MASRKEVHTVPTDKGWANRAANHRRISNPAPRRSPRRPAARSRWRERVHVTGQTGASQRPAPTSAASPRRRGIRPSAAS